MYPREDRTGGACRPGDHAAWHDQLETMGAELFLRYRKCLDEPGVLWRMHQDYPGLSWPDLLIRLRAGRQLIREGHAFAALQLIRDGRWAGLLAERRERLAHTAALRHAGTDRLARWQVALGGLLFAVFCGLSLIAADPGAHLALPALVLVAMILAALAWRGRRALRRAVVPAHSVIGGRCRPA